MLERIEELYLFEEIVKIQYVEQMKIAAGQMVGGCYFRHVGGKMWLF